MQPTSEIAKKTLVVASRAKRVIAAVLLVLMFLVVIVGTLELVVLVVAEIARSLALGSGEFYFLLSEEALFRVFGLFLNVLIAIELIETVEVYFREHALHAETVILVAIIAIARKAILLDLGAYDALTVAALAALIVTLGATYYLVKRDRRVVLPSEEPDEGGASA